MAKEKKIEISVATIFEGTRDGRQAFIELILHKRRTEHKNIEIDASLPEKYNKNKVFSDVHAG